MDPAAVRGVRALRRRTRLQRGRFDEELDRRADPIASAAHRLELERMAAEVGAVMVALQHDLIDADDFAR